MNIRLLLSTAIGIALASISLFAQETQTEQTWNMNKCFSIGLGYNTTNIPTVGYNLIDLPGMRNAMKPFEITMKYSINEKHSLYATIPLYFHKHKNGGFDSTFVVRQRIEGETEWITTYMHTGNPTGLKQRLYGIGLGYNYSFIRYRNLNGFCGVGFNYFHAKERHHLNQPVAYTEEEIKKMVYQTTTFNDYALSPQAGLDYRYKKFEVEIKYNCYFIREREKWIEQPENRSITTKSKTGHTNKVKEGLSFALFYYF